MGATVTSMFVTSTGRADAHNRFFDRGKARRSVHNAQTASPQNRLEKSLVSGETCPWNIDLRSVPSFSFFSRLRLSRDRDEPVRQFPVRRNRSTARTHLRRAILRVPASNRRNRLGNKLLRVPCLSIRSCQADPSRYPPTDFITRPWYIRR